MRPREDRLIGELFARHSADGESVLIGPGDDAALLRCPPGEDLLITTDALNEGVHFPAGMPAHALGYRALAVSLSDLAAMAARPLWALVTLSVPAADEGWLRDFADGLYLLAGESRVRVVGGDFVRGPLSVTVTAHGAARADATLRRAGAAAGDGIWVSGTLGDAAAGLHLLGKEDVAHAAAPPSAKPSLGREGVPPSGKGRRLPYQAGAVEDALTRRFCYPQPRIALGRKLAPLASACMDLSDGLAQDLPRLLRSNGLAAQVQIERLPLSGALKAHAGEERARKLAWSGGDDYELCFTAAPENERRLAALPAGPPVTRIGELRHGEGLEITLDGAPWQPPDPGFTHF